MLRSLWLWVELGFAILALVLFCIACHVMWPDKDGMAAWVQAIGAVAAIVWAGKFTNDQMRAQRELQFEAAKNALVQRLESFIALCEVAKAEVRILDGILRPTVDDNREAGRLMWSVTKILNYAYHTYEPKTFDGLAAALNVFPIHELPSANSVGAAQRFRDGFMHATKAISEWVTEFRKTQTIDSDEARRFFMAADYLYGQFAALEKHLAKLKQA